tara:strand:+ start:3886 stop:4383 length:498 start_codon:yes stop_codon:yes gene_type:complete
MSTRPKIRTQKNVWDRVLEAIAIGALVYGIVVVLQAWSTLPTTIPTHFDAAGNADGFGNKGMIWLLPAISAVMVPSMLFLRRFPWLSNVPIEITVDNAAYQYALTVRLLSLLSCTVSLLFTVLVYDTISIAGGGNSLLGWAFMPVFIGGVMAPILWYFFKAFTGH